MVLPDFLLVGAAKSGTTSLYNYLREHPHIYMPKIKEPQFFMSDILREVDRECYFYERIKNEIAKKQIVSDFETYQKLFCLEGRSAKRVGEGSVAYLYYYREVIPRIKHILGEPDIIIILRNPVDRAFSSYMHLIRNGGVDESFEDFIKNEKDRRKKKFPITFYGIGAGLYYEQVKAYLDNFERIHVILYDDFVQNTKNVIRIVYRFLGVDEFFSANLSTKYNKSYGPKIKTIHKLITREYFFKRYLRLLWQALPYQIRNQVLDYNKTRIEMTQEQRETVKSFFRRDISKLENLLGLNLEAWRT